MSSNNNPKAIQTFYDLEIARCNEKWTDIPELAKRYKKYHPYESVLEFTARMEAEFILLIRQMRQEKYQSILTSSSPVNKKSDTSQVDLPLPLSSSISPPSSPVPQQQTIRKWGARQFSSTSNLNLNNSTASSPVTTPGIAGAPGTFGIRSNYPEESDLIYQLDDPNNVSMHIRLPSSSVQLVLVRLLDVIQRQIKSGELETPDDWQAQFSKIILARIYFETGRYEKTLEWLQYLALRLEDVETGYGLVLLVQARVMKGVCFEQAGNDQDALESYLAALQVVEQHPQETNRALAYWIEEGLYRSILLQLRKKGPVKQTLKLMRTYLQYCKQSWPTDWRIYKKWIIFRHYIRYLTRAYQKGVYVPATSQDEFVAAAPTTTGRSVFSDAGETTLYERSLAALEETIQLMTQFRNLLSIFASSSSKKDPLDIHHRTLELSNLLVSAHDTVGWGPIDYIKRTEKYFTRSRKLTFNSLCTTRHLFYSHVKLGEIKQAKLALVNYFELLGVPNILELGSEAAQEDDEDQEDRLEQVVDILQNRLEYINEQSIMSASKNIWEIELKLRKLQEGEEDFSEGDKELVEGQVPRKKTPTGSCESDTEFDVVRLILTATQQLYNKEDQEAATILCDVAVALLEESETLKRKKASQYKSLMASSKRQRGVAYGLYASQCHDIEKRSEYLTESLLSLKRASELDSRSWQVFYQLALQQAIMGDMTSASTSIKRAIKLRGDYMPSWHLLALIQTSRQFHSPLPQSLQVIQAGLAYHLNMVENFDNEEINENMTLDTEEGQEFFDRAEAYIKLRMTQAKLLEVLEGSESVLMVLPDLFDMFSKLSKKMNLVIAVPVLVVEKSTDFSGSVRSRKSSIARTNSSIHSNSSIFLPPDDDNESVNSSSNITEEDNSMIRASSTNNALLKVNEEEEEDAEEDDDKYFSGSKKDSSKKDTTKKSNSRKSSNFSTKLMDDPLMSFPIAKKEKKEKNKDKPAKRSNFLSLKRNSSAATEAALKKKDAEQQQKLLQQQQQQQQQEAALAAASVAASNNKVATIMSRRNSGSNYTVRSSSTNLLPPSHQQTYSSLLSTKQDGSSVHLPSSSASIIESEEYKQRQGRWQELVIQIWILASSIYARSARFEEAMKAITEADNISYSHHADVWHRIGINILLEANQLLKKKQGDVVTAGKELQERALDAFKRALAIDPEHVSTHVSLATLYIDLNQFELAEQLLERSTKGLGWNRPEAWYLLSQVYRQQDNVLDAKNSLQFALQLSETNPIIPLSNDLLPRFV